VEKGKIIFLNGVSSSGKTSLARTLQTLLPAPFFLLALDTFFEMSPSLPFINVPPDKFEKKIMDEAYQKLLSVFHYTIKNFSDAGINVIVDHVLMKWNKALDQCIMLLHDYPVLFVHVTCPLNELRRRGKERSDRPSGLGESQLVMLEPQETYDMIIDTHNDTKEEYTDKITTLLAYPEKFTAFKTLWSQSKE